MEFCCKFYGSIEFKVVLFGLLLCLSALNEVESACNYYQEMQAGQTYYAFNPEYPNEYKCPNNCIWQTRSPSVTTVNCSYEVMYNNYCQDRLTVQFDGSNEFYTSCGNDKFIFQGMNPTIRLDLNCSSRGRFLCELKTLDQCQCGWKKETRIVGGRETGVNEYPMMAGLVSIKERDIYCGSTIISEQYVLTAAHCVKNRQLNDLLVVVGEHDTQGDETKATKVYPLVRYDIHPYYSTNVNDVAVCKTSENIKFSAEVGPACLPFQHMSNSFAGSIVTALGWGMLEFGGSKATKLQGVDLNVITLGKCQDMFGNTRAITDQDLCTYTKGKDTCQMDSGGPLLWRDPETGRLVLVGIISSGIGCAGNFPGVSMRVGRYIDWIRSVTPDARYCAIE